MIVYNTTHRQFPRYLQYPTGVFVWKAFGSAGASPTVTQHGDWQIYYQDGKGRKKRWRKEWLDREELRAIIRKAVVSKLPAIAEYVEKIEPPRLPPSDVSLVHKALESSRRAKHFIDYDSIMEDRVALQNILSWYYKRQIEITSLEADDDDVLTLLM